MILLSIGRTIPSFGIALAMEKGDWKPFRDALDKSDTKKLDEMFDISRFYISARSNCVRYVRVHPILMSILLYHYKHLLIWLRCVFCKERKKPNRMATQQGPRTIAVEGCNQYEMAPAAYIQRVEPRLACPCLFMGE